MAELGLGVSDASFRLATFKDLEEFMIRQEAHSEAQRAALRELAAEVRCLSSRNGPSRNEASPAPLPMYLFGGGGGGGGGSSGGGRDSPHGNGGPASENGDCIPISSLNFRPKASLASSAGFQEGFREARFSMARALGFDSDSHELRGVSDIPAPETPSRRTLGQRTNTNFISSNAQKVAMRNVTTLHRVLRSVGFENACGFAILVNAVLIGIHANRRGEAPDRCEDFWQDVFLGFNIFFIVELVSRIFTFRKDFFVGPDWRWNIFDTIIVLSSVMEEVVRLWGGQTECSMSTGQTSDSKPKAASGITALRIIRVMRVVRIVRAFRTMSIFRELRLMVASTLNCLVPLAWASLLLCFIQWCFSVYFVHLNADYAAQAMNEFGPDVLTDPTKPHKLARKYFGSLSASVYTLYMSITGGIDWNAAVDSLYEVSDQQHVFWLYIVFIAITIFAVLNVITGVFVENATKVAFRDREFIIQDTLQRREDYKKAALAVFHEADSDGSGQVSYQEFENLLEDPRVQAFFENLELDVMGAHRMFRLLDLDGNGLVSAQEFVTGCMCLKGEAKTLDVAALLLEFHKMSKKVNVTMSKLESDIAGLSSAMTILRL